MAGNIDTENSLSKFKSLIKTWIQGNDSKLIFSSLLLNPLSENDAFNQSFQSISYDGRLIKEVVCCAKCRALFSFKRNDNYNLKRHLIIHKKPKSTPEIYPSIISNGNPLTSNLNISTESRVEPNVEMEILAINPEVASLPTTRLSNNSDENDVWSDALDSL